MADMTQQCDEAIIDVAQKLEKRGASFGLIVDRLLTIAAAQIVLERGEVATAAEFRRLASNIDQGAFAGMKISLRSKN